MARKNDVAEVATESVGSLLLKALVQEIKVQPDIWPQMSEAEQTELIERLRKKVTDIVRDAVYLIASEQRVTVNACLKKIVFGDHVEAVFTIGDDPARLELAECRGQACLIVVTNAAAHIGGMDGVQGDADQPTLPGVDDGGAAQILEQARRRSKRKPPADKGAPDPFH